ncbi:MAG: ABC transporter permease [Crocosphaera sp.]|nr:ABC transporter permease [Crocosphaera sp.]
MTNAQSTQTDNPLNKLIDFFDSETILYIIKRVLQGLLTILLASIVSFIIIQIAPGDYLDNLKQNPKIAKETIEQLTVRFGLDKPWYIQYWRWLVQVVTRFNFGESFVYNRSVASLLAERILATLLLAIASIIITWLIAIPLGIISAVKQSTWLDKILRVISYLGQGFPSFITALVLLIIAQYVSPLLPVGNMTSLNHAELSPLGKILDIGWHMILPTIALSITSFAGLMRLMRGQMLDVMRQDYIQTARAKGLPEDKVIYVHALRNAINPLITLLGFEFSSLLGGSFIAEFFFNWPGLGRLILQAVTAQDLYLVMGSLTMGATMLIVGNLLADLLLKVVDPRIKLENRK